ncbi:hypothetical protein KUTeg_020818 [Tegillarca granosa]|uniref:Uncharacterized protein n=1 Tax=Tegillarca granosa TaxID=220873 RepID=A0ABQ9EBP9_TEGGR|nr:hypothetical protein KUTeg_020818 [Tegillarca granosa]
MILFIPDIITKKAIDAKLREDVYPYWEKIMSCVQYGKTKIIMTCNNHVMDDIWFILRGFDIFNESCHIDMCNVKLTEEEKIKMLKAHCENNNIDISTEIDKENQNNVYNANLCDHKLVLSETVISDIARIELPLKHIALGFPLACSLFCKDRHYSALGKNFFLRPSKYLVDQIDGLRIQNNKEKTDQYELLKTLWFKHDKNYDKTEVAKYGKAINDLLGTYIEKTEDDKYMLKYETIYIAVGLSIAKKNQRV